VRYVSTRGNAPELDFEGAMLSGLALDGGLYVPAEWPVFSPRDIADMAGLPYEETAFRVMSPFIGDAFAPDEFRAMIERAYSTFGHAARAPLVQMGEADWILELHHGPTLAFKDFAMQLIGQMFETALQRRGERVTIIGATSGDTGSAAIEAFKGLESVDVFILYPHGRVSEVQRRQMTTPDEANVHALAVEGDFDDCQALVKAAFNDHAFRDQAKLAAVNSINWARVLAQTVYYFTSAAALGAPYRPVSYSVPTGNFGDVYAGWVARRMGLPVERLVVATNQNDILHRTIQSGDHSRAEVVPSTSPSMDIQVSSNFERVLFDMLDRDAAMTAEHMRMLQEEGGFRLSNLTHSRLTAEFASAAAGEEDVDAVIAAMLEVTGQVLDPHTAIGVKAAAEARGDAATPMVVLGTAHAAKFPDAVQAACGVRPELPARMADLYRRPERVMRVANDLNAVQAVIREHGATTENLWA